VGNIPKHYNEDELLPLFERVGAVVELSITRDKVSKASKGSAFLW
jgi:RNA recognition motif-containing protein